MVIPGDSLYEKQPYSGEEYGWFSQRESRLCFGSPTGVNLKWGRWTLDLQSSEPSTYSLNRRAWFITHCKHMTVNVSQDQLRIASN